MDRTTLQTLSSTRLKEATALLGAGLSCGAYYLAGYSAECALKACIAKETRAFDFPDRKRVIASYSHNLLELIGTAGLSKVLETELKANASFRTNWLIVKDWNVERRYDLSVDLATATALVEAIGDPVNGVLQWLTKHW